MKFILLLAISLSLLSCSKYECIKDAAPDLIGEWVHYSQNDGFHIIYIQKNGRGSMWGENDHGNTRDSQSRGWYLKDDVLYFSRFWNKVEEDKFVVNEYPQVAVNDINLPYDTIKAGMEYVVLDYRIYKKY